MYATQKNINKKEPTTNDNTYCNKYLLFPDNTGKRKTEGGLRLKGKYKLSTAVKPIITVITVVYNNEATIERCIKSVLEQTYDNIEYIIIDGGSSDGTLDIIKKYQDSIDYFISEPDGGIYYAMNKGIALASGDYLNFMNSDDWFSEKKSISNIIPYINGSKDNIIYGKIMYYKDTTSLHESSYLSIDENILIGHPIPHQAAFIAKKSFNILGNYDTNLTLAADYDWWVRAKVQNIKFINTKEVIANFTSGGSNHQSFLLGQIEAIISLYNHKVENVNEPLKTSKFADTLKKTDFNELEMTLNKIKHNYNINVLLKNLLIPKISIIVPVYNVSKYLQKCLESIVNQTLKEIEIIIINDCSPDLKDDEICMEYANKDNRIVYIKHTKNKGLGGARNTALNIARGEYIWFIDSDDFIDINACEYLYNTSNELKVDVLAFSANSYHIKEDKLVLDYSGGYYSYERNKELYTQKLKGDDFLKLFQDLVSPCLYLFNLELFNNFRFREKVFHEDTDLIPIVLFNAKQIATVKYSPYFRLLRQESITQEDWTELRLLNYFSSLESLFYYTQSNILAQNSSLKTICENRYRYTINILVPSVNIESDNITKQMIHLKVLYDNMFLNTKLLSVSSEPCLSIQETVKIKETLNERLYRFKKMSKKRKVWTIGKVISKKVKIHGILQPTVKKIKLGKYFANKKS